MKILDRYIVLELLGPFLMGTATFTLLFMSMDTLFRVARMVVEGAHFREAFEFLFFSLPYILVLTFPMAVLLASLMAFGRLSSDSELTALKAGGISFIRIAIPGIILSLVISCGAYFLNEKIVPLTMYKANNLMFKDAEKEQGEGIKDNISLRETLADGAERKIFARKLDTNQGVMSGVTIQNFQDGVRTEEIYAVRVVWQEDHWIMYDVNTYAYNAQQDVTTSSSSASAVLTLAKNPLQLALRDKLPEEMSRVQLKEQIQKMELSRQPKDTSYNRYVLMYHEKLAIPFTCFVFGMLGMPLGVRPQRTSPSVGLGISLIFILFYYVLMTVAHALGENSVLPAGFAAWLPNVVFGILGIRLVVRASRS